MATDDLERLITAFGVDVLKRVAEADGHLDAREIQALEGVYPEGRLRDLGFVDEFGLTKHWEAAAAGGGLTLRPKPSTMPNALR